MRFGLDDGKVAPSTRSVEAFGITRERVRQIEVKTMAKLRRPERSTPAAGIPRRPRSDGAPTEAVPAGC